MTLLFAIHMHAPTVCTRDEKVFILKLRLEGVLFIISRLTDVQTAVTCCLKICLHSSSVCRTADVSHYHLQ